MLVKKTLQQRQKELQALLITQEGRKELEDLESRYAASSDKHKPLNTSIITYLLVHEREQGIIAG